MGHSSEDDTDISDSELENYSETCYQQLRDGDFEVNISGEVYRCPYCFHKKRKQQYGYKDLLQHASAIAEGSGCKWGTKEKGKHLGLVRYLESLGQSKTPEIISPGVMRHSEDSDNEELFVYPWIGIVANIPVTFEKGKYVMEKSEKLRSEFMSNGFNPTKVTPLRNYKSHICFAVVEFSKGWPGFHCAMKFDQSFEAAGKGKLGYLEAKHWGTEVYGWIGREDDYYSDKAFGDFLRKSKELKTIDDIETEEKSESIKQLSNLSTVIAEKNMHLRVIEVQYNETLKSVNNLITEKDKMFQAYKEGM